MTDKPFILGNGSQTFGVAYTNGQAVPTGSGQSLRCDNMNLAFDFQVVGFPVSKVMLEFNDFGGSENIAVNGGLAVNQELSAQPLPPTIGGVAATAIVTAVPASPTNPAITNRYGTLKLTGAIQSILIGGKELWTDRICAGG